MSFPASLPIPAPVLAIAKKLSGAGYDVWCVGGAVRDNLLGDANKDFDLATSATPQEVRRLFRRTIPIGVEHGTVAVLDRDGQPHEVTTFRRDVKTDGRHAEVEFGVSLDDDLARRDFTINAIAYHPLSHEWRDPLGGADDLEAGVLRAVGDPAARFREDYLRILRLLRFAARFGFEIDPATWEAAKADAEGLRGLSAERVREEWMRGLSGARKPSELVRLWVEVGAVGIWLPELGRGEGGGVRSDGAVGVDAGLHTSESETPSEAPPPPSLLPTLDRISPRDPVLLTAYLSSDPAATLARLRCSNAEVGRGKAVGEHRGSLPNPEEPVEVRRWMAAAGDAVEDLVVIARAEGEGERLAAAVRAVRASGAPLSIADLAVGGKDLMEAGLPEGPQVGETLRHLLDRVLEDPELNTRDALLRLVREGTFHVSRLTSHEVRGRRGRGE